MAMAITIKKVIFFFITWSTFIVVRGQSILPNNENCVPEINGNCQKGDLIDTTIADCCYTGPITCDAIDDGWWDRTVNPAVGDRCQPCSGQYRFTCGDTGTNSRCVCDDKVAYDVLGNRCRCQYWPTTPSHTVPPNTEHATTATTHATTTDSSTTTAETMPTTPPSRNTTDTPNNKEHIVIITVPTIIAVAILVITIVVIASCCVKKYCSKKCNYTPI